MIVVGGEALVDLIVDPAGGIDPRPGGGPFNTARTIGRLGGDARFLGRLSSDRFGATLRGLLRADGVGLACPEATDAPTTLALAELDGAGHASYHFYTQGTSAPALGPGDLELTRREIGAGAALHVGTLGLVLEPMASTLEGLVREAPTESLVMVDPNCRPALIPDLDAYRSRILALLARADIVKVSDEDLAILAPGSEPVTAARRLVAAGSRVVLVTAGAAPATAVTADGLADTVGAGDAFGGGFLAWWVAAGLGREELGDAGRLRAAVGAAVAVSAITCERPGAAPPTLAEVRERGLDWPTA
jgi:fructokinase